MDLSFKTLCFGGDLCLQTDSEHLGENLFGFLAYRLYIYMKAMAPPSSTLAWKIPWTEEPGRLQSMGLLGVGHFSLFTFMH